MSRRTIDLAAILALGVVIVSGVAIAQSALPVPPEEYVTTRQALMTSTDDAMYEMETAIESGTVDMTLLPLRASAIATNLRAFALMFPADTNFPNQVSPADPNVTTSSSPAVFEEFEAFQAEVHAMASLAEEAGYTGTVEEFAPLVAKLREGCTSCHDKFVAYEDTGPATP